ncbi:MAG: hypothetical protein IKZ95_00710 [Lachnospiraceae bacterium]|nr:hypothetical protein [Lachnospiraceae bacterium]
MTINELYQKILSGFYELDGAKALLNETVSVKKSEEPERTLRPENDPPSTVARPEYCVTATLCGAKGEAYTEEPSDFSGTLQQALEIPPTEKGISAVTVAALNAAVNYLGLAPGAFPKGEEARFSYADALCRYVTEHYGRSNIILVGYDGYLVKRFMDEGLDFWTMDRDPDHISQNRFQHVVVNNAKRNRDSSFVWGKYFIVTGSTLCNGTILHYLDCGKEVLFYGITCAGAATLLHLPWFSPDHM